MKCQYCGSELDQDSVYCAVCGNKVEQPAAKSRGNGSYCPYCGEYNDLDDIYCARCGRDLLGDDEENLAKEKGGSLKYIIMALAIVLVLALAGGGAYFVMNADWGQEEEEEEDTEKSEDSESSIEEVMEYIDDIGKVDLDSEKAIKKARDAYDGLTRKQQRKVENYDELKDAEEALEELKDGQEAAEEVMDYITDIGIVDANSGDLIEKAREAYDNLTDEQQELVENYGILTDAEEAYESLKDEKENSSMYILSESSQRTISTSELSGLTLKELGYARNEIYARHGRMFKSQELQSYFDSKSWYSGTISPSNFSESMLNEVEKRNIELIQAEENSRGGAYTFN